MSENINLQNEEENVIVATFNIATENTTITLKNLTDMTQIDWGDGIIDSELTHTYSQIGEYTCKIYSVTSIGFSAFYNCSSLTSIEIPDSVTMIGEGAFSDCGSLTSIEIPDSVTSIADRAFYGCSSLTSVMIGNSVTTIGDSAFAGCDSLTSIEIPDSVTTIGNSAFYGCSSLTSVVIGDSVTTIGDQAFHYCYSLTSVTIPDSVTSIGGYAFNICSNLTSVVIGDGVTSIGGFAFYNCSSLTSVTFKSKNPISVDMITDSRINNSTPTYYVPTDSIEAYRNAWSGTVAEEKIQPDLDELLINLEGLRTYHDTLKEKYLDFMATQDWVQEQLVGKTDYLGVTNTLPNFPNAGAGDYCRVQTEFVYDAATGEKAHVGDVLIAVKDNPTQSIADWDLLHNELTSATLVTVGGVAQTSWDADTKIDKPSTPPSVGKVLKVVSVNKDGTIVCEWGDGGAVNDITLNGTSVVNNGVATIPIADKGSLGAVRGNNKYGITADGGLLAVYGANAGDISNRSTYFRPITPGNMDLAVKDALCDGKGEEWLNYEQKAARERFGLSYLSEDKDLKFLDIGIPGILKRFFSNSLLMGDTHYGNGFIQTKSGGRLLFPDIRSNSETMSTYRQLINRFRIDYFDLGDGMTYRKSKIKLVPNSILVITENSYWQASAVGMVDNNGKLSETDILPHTKTDSVGGTYYDVATTAFIVTGYENQVYSSDSKYCQVVRITIDGLNTKIKFFSVKEVDGTVLTVSMKSSGTHRECISLGALLPR